MATSEEGQPKINLNEESNVLAEYLDLFDCLGYRYKYFMAPNAHLDWFGTYNVRTPLRIHEFLLEKFGGRCRHANFNRAVGCGPIETTASHMRIRKMPKREAELINPKNIVPESTSLRKRADSDIEDGDVEMFNATPEPTSSKRVESTEATYSSDEESEEYNVRKCKRMKYNFSTSFQYLKRLPTRKPQETTGQYSDDDSSSSDNDHADDNEKGCGKKDTRKQIATNGSKYSQLCYLEALGTILKSRSRSLGGGFAERQVRLRIAYRKNYIDGSIQFALIIYERLDQKNRTNRSRRMLDFSQCTEDDEQSESEETECVGSPPTLIRSNDDEELAPGTIASAQTPTGSEIATALEEAAFTIQPPIQRTPTKSTPIPPGTPKRRARSTQLNMSGLAPLTMTSAKKSNPTPATTPKLSAARSLRL